MKLRLMTEGHRELTVAAKMKQQNIGHERTVERTPPLFQRIRDVSGR